MNDSQGNPPPPPQTLSILVPVYNEAQWVGRVLEHLLVIDFCGLKTDIIVVDDGSQDGTPAALKPYECMSPFQVYYHKRNQGKGAAIRTALEHAAGDIIIIQDADLEYNPEDYPALIRYILDDRADVVYGSRLSEGRPPKAFSTAHYLGNKVLTLVTNWLYQTHLTDMETCYKVFKGEVLRHIRLRADRFDFEPEITAKVLKQRVRLLEVPISYSGRNHADGKKIHWFDGLQALWTLVKYRFVD